MTRSLYTKLAAVLIAVFVLVGCMVAVVIVYSSDMYHQELYQKINRDLARHIVESEPLVRDGQPDHERLRTLFDTMMALNPSVEVYLLDANGKILSYSAPPGKVRAERVDIGAIKRFLAGETLPVLGDDPRQPGRRKIFSAAPIVQPGDPLCYLYVIAAGEEYDSAAAMLHGSYILKLSLWGAGAGLMFALLAALVLFAYLTRRLKRLTTEVEGFGADGFREPEAHPPGQHPGGDEIDRLGLTFRKMARQLAAQVEHLKETDSLRRELVANVSHDLRTPLTSLQGYLETLLLKEGSLSPDEKRRYLEIAARDSEHLGHLVAELFELAKLDSTSEVPPRELFALGELVQDVLQKFELRAREAGVHLGTRLDAKLPFVYANVGLIERVLENLLDNALRHTPPGGRVDVVLEPGERAVTVHVSDTGCGIAEQDLPHIFERFYRPSTPSPRNGDGTGLGLAIARRILELHGSRIEAASMAAAGATFTFDLPIRDAA